MFCTQCGSQIPQGAHFCVGCGARVANAAPPASAPDPMAPSVPAAPQVPETTFLPKEAFDPRTTTYPPTTTAPPPVAQAAHSSKEVTCAWCGAVSTGSLSCPRCGAALNIPEDVSESGWIEVPGRKDMTKIHMGNSSCQIEGLYVPVADINLAAGDSIYFTHHVMLWKDPQIAVTAMSMRGAWKRMFAGLPLVMTQASGPGRIAFSRDEPGELMPVPLQPGDAIDVREHLFLVASSSVEYDWFPTNVWLKTQQGNDTETHYPIGMFMDRFHAPQVPGMLLLHAAGNVFVRQLGEGETILVKPTALVFKDPSVQMHLHFERPGTNFYGWGTWANRYLWLRMIGPGRVAIQ